MACSAIWARRGVIGLIALVAILALANVFGQHRRR
jgi:hypothetical protein